MAGVQVVHLAVYVYFAASLVGEQWIIKGRSDFKRKDEEVGPGVVYHIYASFTRTGFVPIS